MTGKIPPGETGSCPEGNPEGKPGEIKQSEQRRFCDRLPLEFSDCFPYRLRGETLQKIARNRKHAKKEEKRKQRKGKPEVKKEGKLASPIEGGESSYGSPSFSDEGN